MLYFWDIFVVFFACVAFQLAESRIQNDYHPYSLSASDELSDIFNSIIDSSKDGSSSFVHGINLEDTSASYPEETQVDTLQYMGHSIETESTESSVGSSTPSARTSKMRLSLSERREALYLFTDILTIVYSKDYVGKTRDVLNKLILELEALTAKSDDVKERLTELKGTLTELDGFDIESDDLQEASDIISDLRGELYEPINEPPEVVVALRKVGWIDVGNELSEEMVVITHKFVTAFNQFVATLTPWERLTEADLVDLNKRFNDNTIVDQWDLFNEFWTYFE
ncbi:uncharacterized protein LOC125779423 [Bactrocera dorsalis]|uniref:Uncharacterized protein LOC125779423 n=1 Tax=Bactrocera dorsalis TaxID=27457 RepID=A0ABM3K5J1_BACDO|nr:uncharacterized protein LOC125779423 [Bactrocera dorsalis]